MEAWRALGLWGFYKLYMVMLCCEFESGFEAKALCLGIAIASSVNSGAEHTWMRKLLNDLT